MNVRIGTVASQFLFLGLYVSDFRYSIFAVYAIMYCTVLYCIYAVR